MLDHHDTIVIIIARPRGFCSIPFAKKMFSGFYTVTLPSHGNIKLVSGIPGLSAVRSQR